MNAPNPPNPKEKIKIPIHRIILLFDNEKIKTPILLTYTELEEQIYIDQSKDFYSKIKDNNHNNMTHIFKGIDHYHEPNAMNKNNKSWDKTFNDWLQNLA